MDYLERLAEISACANLTEDQKDLLRDLTDPLCGKDRDCIVAVIRGIIFELVKYKKCEELAKLIQNKWTHIELEPDAYKDLIDDVSCG